MSDEVVISMGPLRPTWKASGKDFANMLKAFMGCNYLTIAFAMSQSGLGLGLAGIFMIASLTAHCCNLIVKCKYHAIRILLENKEQDSIEGGKELCPPSCELEAEVRGQDGNYLSKYHKYLVRSLNYADIGQLCFGKGGVALVNIPIIITQFGFCIAYYIFIGNSLQSMFPLYNCTMPVANSSVPVPSGDIQCFHLKSINSLRTTPMDVVNLTEDVPGSLHHDTRWMFASHLEGNTSVTPGNPTATTFSPTSFNSTTTSTVIISTSLAYNTTLIPWSNLSRWILTRGKHVPDLRLLVLTPALIFVIMALIRSVRSMGWLSLMANTGIFFGCGEVLYFLISGFYVSGAFQWINWSGIPIFFGLVTSSFEGIGTILPIEGSMEGNRHNFTKYLFGAVTVLAVVLITFGTLGYVHFGTDIEQMVNANIPSGDKMNILVNVSLIVGVLLTFPLMMHPVVELTEIMLFVTGCACSPIDHSDHDNEGEEQPLLPKTEGAASANGDKIPSHVPAWKRNIIRALLVLFAGGIAVLLRNYFAYISAFIGALGSTMLAYILPCLFHLKLCWANLCLATKIKDIAIIIIGITFGITGMYSVLHEIIA